MQCRPGDHSLRRRNASQPGGAATGKLSALAESIAAPPHECDARRGAGQRPAAAN